MIRKLLFIAIGVAGCGVFVLATQQGGVTVGEKMGVFTEDQATAGKTEYLKTCATCHTEGLIPAEGAKYQGRDIPPLAGTKFMQKWGGRTTRDLTARVKIAAGEETHINVAAYILQFNGARAGHQALTPETAVEIRSITKEEDKEKLNPFCRR